MRLPASIAIALFAAAACGDGASGNETLYETRQAALAASSGVHFLPPLGTAGAPTGAFVADAPVTVRIFDENGVEHRRFEGADIRVDAVDERYQVDWKTRRSDEGLFTIVVSTPSRDVASIEVELTDGAPGKKKHGKKHHHHGHHGHNGHGHHNHHGHGHGHHGHHNHDGHGHHGHDNHHGHGHHGHCRGDSNSNDDVAPSGGTHRAGSNLLIAFRITAEAVDVDGDGARDWEDRCPLLANESTDDVDCDGVDDTPEPVEPVEPAGIRITSAGEAYGHHGSCDGWNGCGDAATCALWACMVNGYSSLVSHGASGPCTGFASCNLLDGPNDVQMGWGNFCEVLCVTDIDCAP